MNFEKKEEIKNKISVALIIERHYPKWLPGTRKHGCGSCMAVWRGEHRASLSIYDEGRRCTDHGTGEHFDVFDLVMMFHECSFKEAFEYLSKMLASINHIEPCATTQPPPGSGRPPARRLTLRHR